MTVVREVMHQGLISCRPETPLVDVAVELVRNRIHAVVVTENGLPMGVVADTDLLAGEWLARDDESFQTMRAMSAGELMSTPVVTIEAEAPVERAAARLAKDPLSRLVVLQDGAAVGVVTIADLVRELARVPRGRRRVSDVMSRGFVVCRRDTPLTAAARAMVERHSRSIVVTELDGRPLGIVTGRDLLHPESADLGTLTVDELMHPPETIHPEATLQAAADRMLERETHRLLVVDDPGILPMGLISTMDIVAEMAAPASPWHPTH